MSPARTVGVIGLGPMGRALTASLLAAGYGVRCRTLDVTDDFFAATGGTPFRDLPYPRSSELLAALCADR